MRRIPLHPCVVPARPAGPQRPSGRWLPALICLALLPGTILAQSDGATGPSLRPGLWSATVQPAAGDARTQAMMTRLQGLLAQASPQQRERLQALLAQQQMSLNPEGGGLSARFCLSPEQAARGEPPVDPQGRCRSTVVGRSAQSLQLQFACSQPAGSGTAALQVLDETRYTAVVDMQPTQAGGASARLAVQGQWLSAACTGNPASP